ncbi:transporter [Sphingomonas nostoxanthinifaciens]|uniref:transporter n=1 Tax=Sphingomonas nostoxanthinifaciens TaxID=2872652 RepID=UPI001CC1D8A0|nr:transporter [Sphingomonas nostoxanthinifaciens]UAK26091.1 transporter [Sphingomonas nostoxanthinifaciens]
MRFVLGLLVCAAAAAPVWAQDAQQPKLRDLCSDRPGLDTPACTVDPGHLQVEVGLGDWTLDKQPDQRTDTIDAGQIALRYGVGATTEVRLGWTAYGNVRQRDRLTGEIDRTSGIGDVTLGLKQNLRHPAEKSGGLAVALLPFVTVPVGHRQVGAGDWGGGLIVPTSYKLNDTVSLELSPEVDAAVNQSGDGRHLSYGSAMGVQVHLSKTIRLTPELQFVRDRDPAQRATMSRAALSLDVQPQKLTQLDVQAVAGLNHNTPAVELSFGVSRKF